MSLSRMLQPVFCTFGFHEAPEQRLPPGPIVASCPCCGRVTYFYGLTAHGINAYPHLMMPAFPKVTGTVVRRIYAS